MRSLRTCIIVNNAAGSVDDADSLLSKLRASFADAEFLSPQSAGDAAKLARDAQSDGFERVIAAGGDGTLNEVVNGLSNDFGRCCLGLLPLGTGNDFARSIGMPEDVDEALELLRRDRSIRVDVARVTTTAVRYMINVSAGGFSAKVDEKLTDDVKERWGPFSYARSFFAALPELDHYHSEIIVNDEERLDAPAYNVIVANGRFVAGGVPIAPSARIDDGCLDLLILPVANLSQLALLAPATLLGKHLENDQLVFRRARKVRVQSQPAMRFNTDGELIGDDPVTFEVLPRALQMIVGEPPPGICAGS